MQKIKISSVVSKVFGVTSLNMIGVLLEKDELSAAEEIGQMANGKLKKKINQLVEALNGTSIQTNWKTRFRNPRKAGAL